MSVISVTWEMEDGYCGKARPHHTKFESEDYEDGKWDDIDEQRKNEIIDKVVQEDFKNKISFSITRIETGNS